MTTDRPKQKVQLEVNPVSEYYDGLTYGVQLRFQVFRPEDAVELLRVVEDALRERDLL